ncbi:hypothetical protein CKO11_13975 [Rhodobacter sp. TJ_12]|uniref:calcium-binding protein n=1 Tax=Rhodobacter sp. TJ_12 TaxID=2029399 RepID=UPI001CBC6A6D|nr:calcium-binding protein [Rhodobacter sp. TJ_12]MBZ4023566.1 hypothetical protein [Rhodobacter sp. TJ_12]
MPTITFSEYSLYTRNPTFTFDDNIVTTTGVIVSDGAQPQTPVIAANSSYTGPVFIYFDTPVTSVSLDVGYFNNIGSTRIEFRDQFGQLIQSFHNDAEGVQTFSLTSENGIASIAAIDEAYDVSGFSVDTIVFDGLADVVDAPIVSRVANRNFVDQDFGDVEGGRTLIFSDQVGTADPQDFLQLTVSNATTAQIRTYLNSDPTNASTYTVNLVAGQNTLQILQNDDYGDLEDYTVVVQITDYVDANQEFVDDIKALIIGKVVSYQELESEIFRHVTQNLDNADDAAALFGKMARGFKILGLVLDIGSRIDNIQAASDWRRQTAMELGDMLTGMASTGLVGVGVSFVGTPIAGAVAGFVTGLVYDLALSNYVKNQIGDAYDAYQGGADTELLVGDDAADLMRADPDFSDLIFDETWYLAQYSDAAEAVASGAAVNGLAHYLTTGIGLGYQINATGRTVDPADLSDDFGITDAANLFDNQLGTHALGTRAGDLLNAGEVAFVTYVNEEQRTEDTNLALNADLSALANRVAQDWILNNPAIIELAMTQSDDWAETLSSGENYADVLADLATAAGIDLSYVTLLATWKAGEDLSDVYDALVTSIEASQALIGIDSHSIGVAQVGALWIVLVSTQSLSDDGVASDTSVMRLFGDELGDQILGSVGMDRIEGFAGDDDLQGRGGNDLLLGGADNDSLTGGAGADTLRGDAGNDTLIGDGVAVMEDPGEGEGEGEGGVTVDLFTDITVMGSGVLEIGADVVNTLENPLQLTNVWSLAETPNILNSTTNPHVSLQITGSGDTYEAFTFSVRAGEVWTFDVDGTSGFDSYLELYDESGNRIAYDDDSSTSVGGEGSSSSYDSYLEYSFTEDGIWTIALRSYGSHMLTDEATATLNVSVDASGLLPPVEVIPLSYDDMLYGGWGNDRLQGETGNDTLYGGDGRDTLVGGEDDDVIYGGDTDADRGDVIYGGDGHDDIDGGWGNDSITGDAGNDTIAGNYGADTVIGNDGDDYLTGSVYSDLVFGGAGDDFLNGGFGSDRLNGGDGADTIFHTGLRGHGSDWIQDYDAAEGDVLQYGAAGTRNQFQVNFATTPAGQDDVDEAFVIYRPTGQILWALVDGAGQDSINILIGGTEYDLLA